MSRCVAPGEDVVQHRADLALGGDEAGHLGVGRVRQQQVDARRRRAGRSAPRSVRPPSSGSWSILKSPVCSRTPAGVRIATASASGIEWLTAKNSQCERPGRVGRPRPRPRPASASIRCSRSFASTSARVNREPTSGMSAAQPQQVRDGADVVLVPVGEDDGLDVVEPVLDEAEVGQDQVDAGLLGLGEQHAAVDDQQPAGVLEDGHVAADLAEPAERHDPQAALGQRRRAPARSGCGWVTCPLTHAHSAMPPAARSARSCATCSAVASTSGGRTGPAGRPSSSQRGLDHDGALGAAQDAGVDRQQALVAPRAP